MYFIFIFISPFIQRSSVESPKPPNKKRKGLIYCSLVIILRAHESSVNNLSF